MLETIDLSKSINKEEYLRDLIHYQVALHPLGYQVYVQKRPVILVYEGWDAGGKGGNIKRVTEKLDPRGYVVYPISAPSGEDKTHHYLWRFWRRLPEKGQIAIFDRSWYGRVMVERIEGFCTEDEWKRAYREINRFERQLVDFGMILFKFWIHISKEEQMRRFEDRKVTAYKAWKLTDEDWRNRERWDLYNEAVSEMLQKTSTITAPWTIVEGNCKWYARIKVLKTLVEGLSKELGYDPYKDIPPVKKRKKKKAKAKKGPQRKTKENDEVPLEAGTLPMIEKFEYGEMEISGRKLKADVVILPSGKVNTIKPTQEHQINVDELKEIIEVKPEVLIIGSGTIGNMQLEPEGLDRLQQSGVEVIVHKTNKAVEVYKALRGQRKIAALFHLAD